MRRRSTPAEPARDVAVALAALSADALREVLREMLLRLDDKARDSAIHSLIERAARGSGWAPAALRDDEVTDALAFARAAVRAGRAEPSDVDEHLRRASGAFLQKDYSAAHRIFAALLLPIGDGDTSTSGRTSSSTRCSARTPPRARPSTSCRRTCSLLP